MYQQKRKQKSLSHSLSLSLSLSINMYTFSVEEPRSNCGNIVGGNGLQPIKFACDFSVLSTMANLCCAIEMEPKTLNEGQLNHAREVAEDIVQNLEPDKASTIFTKGLRQIPSINEMEQMVEKETAQLLHTMMESKETANNNIIEKPCQCACNSTILESPDDQPMLREPLSAPF